MSNPADPQHSVESPVPLASPLADEAFRLLVEAVSDYAIFLLDPDGRVLSWNAGAERTKGYAAEEIIGRHISVFYTPEARAAGRPGANLADALRFGRTEDEGWRVRKDGSRFWADVVITALHEPGGRLYGYAKVTRDLTERRAAVERERQLAAEQRARQAADEALRARNRFLSIAAHELRTPITSLHLSTEVLRREHRSGKLDPRRFERSMARMTKAAMRLNDLVNELLDVSRLESEFFPLNREPTDLAALVAEGLERYEDTGERHRIEFRASGSVWANIDTLRVEQVITNLIDNALKYSPDSEPVGVEVAEDEDGVVLRVSDRGIGLDEDVRTRLFEPFGRGDNAADTQGIGLGLYIAHRIVEAHCGRIDAHSPGIGQGTAFEVWLPRSGTARASGEAGRDIGSPTV